MKTCPKCGQQFSDTNSLCPVDHIPLVKEGDDLPGKILAGKYRVEERISSGGMGAVYRATHVLMEKTVAIKVLHPALAADDKIVARFTREAKAASRIYHPHALNVTDFGEAEDGVVFLVMEYLRGSTLKQVIRTEGPMPLTRAVEIIRQVCGALDAAHAEGVVHRDLKSDNIMLEEIAPDGGDWAKVLDFGIAKIIEPEGTDQELTAPNLIIGTPQYMSPEQCSQSHDIDHRSDIYSLGIILFEMLVGHVPFTADASTTVMLKHLQESPPSVLEERPDLPSGVGWVISRALAKRPEDRPKSAGELATALSLAAAGEDPSLATAAAALSEEEQESGRDTDRVIIPTSPHDARETGADERDEETVLSPGYKDAATAEGGISSSYPARGDSHEFPAIAPRGYSPERVGAPFSPWRIAIPAVALLAVVFVVMFALERNHPQASQSNQTPSLQNEPGSQPVKPVSPATGAVEKNIPPSTAAAASKGPSTVHATGTPAASGEKNGKHASASNQAQTSKENVKSDEGDDSISDQEDAAPSNGNSNKRRNPSLPRVTPSIDANAEASPLPSPKSEKVDTIKAKPKSSPKPDKSSQTPDQSSGSSSDNP